MNPIHRLIGEIHRRSLWQVSAIFLATAWVVLQVMDVLISNGILPGWVFKVGFVLLLIGLPIVLATAFVQEGMGGSARQVADLPPSEPVIAPPERATRELRMALPERQAYLRAAHRRVLTWRNAILGGLGAFALLGFASAGYMGMRTLGIGAPGTLLAQGMLEQGANVLLADFESGSDSELGSVVTKALRVDLLQSRTIRLLDRSDVAPALERMVVGEDTRMSTERAVQLAEREGYPVIIAGDVAQVGSGYVLTASILGGDGFRPLAAFRETARSDAELIDAIERLSRAIRDKIGDSLRSLRNAPPLAQVTTSSLSALRAYTRGVELQAVGDQIRALEQFERAVQLDSAFAMAYRAHSVALFNQRIRPADMRRSARRAWELSDRLPERERHLTAAHFHMQLSGDIEAAARSYEEALHADSSSIPVRNGLGVLYTFLGRHAEAATLFAGSAGERRTTSLWFNLGVARFLQGDFEGARATLDSGRVALPNWHTGLSLRANQAAALEDYAATDSLLDELARVAQTPVERSRLRESRVRAATMRGRVRDAERMLDEPGRELWMGQAATVAMHRGLNHLQRNERTPALRLATDVLRVLGDSISVDDVISLARVAAEAEDAHLLEDLLNRLTAHTPRHELGIVAQLQHDLFAGALARLKGDHSAARSIFDDIERRCPGRCISQVAYERGRIHDAMGAGDLARGEYERSLRSPDPERNTYVLVQPRVLRRLGELYEADDPQRAAAYYARFLALWRDADPELQPQVRAVQQRLRTLIDR